jgi:hypothetical protein
MVDQPPSKTISIKSCVDLEHDITVEVSPVPLPTQYDRYKPEHKQQNPRSHQSWNAYLGNTLGNRLEEPPLLFNPNSSPLFCSFDFHLDNVPRYLFRTFDWKSLGRSDEDIISSPATEIGTAYCKSDIFSLDTDLAMSIVDRHMNPWGVKDYENHPPDNFMSWTSSLLYAVQYALYRRHHFGCMSEEIKICVVDTHKFPRGQFIHAKCLLQAYYQVVKRIDMRHSISPRLLCYIYQNGEYLSQGLFNHRAGGKSCLLSLADLERAGLYSLYPELAIPEQHSKWAITTANLRKVWTATHVPTSSSELEAAILLARSCFVDFDVLDMAIIILTFKRQKLAQLRSGENPQESFCNMYHARPNEQPTSSTEPAGSSRVWKRCTRVGA